MVNATVKRAYVLMTMFFFSKLSYQDIHRNLDQTPPSSSFLLLLLEVEGGEGGGEGGGEHFTWKINSRLKTALDFETSNSKKKGCRGKMV